MVKEMDVAALKNAELLTPRQQQLRELLTLSERICDSASQGDWSAALPMQQTRRLAMDQFFAVDCPPTEAGLVSAVIEEILKIDDRVTELLHRQRGAMVDSNAQQRRNAENLGSYLRHA